MTEQTYRIGEAARLLGLEGYVLRFWETEFTALQPRRTPKGQRIYSEADLALLRRIRELLHEQGMTIDGARRVLAGEAQSPLEATSCPDAGSGKRAGEGLLSVHQPLAPPPPVQGLLPTFTSRSEEERRLDTLIQVERELVSLQRLLRQSG